MSEGVNDSILETTKKMVGLGETDTSFDLDIITHINTVFTILSQIGVGPEDGFMIMDKNAKWADYTDGVKNLNAVKSYTFLRVRMLFDPPTTSYLITALKENQQELEWRLGVTADRPELPVSDDGELVWIIDSTDPFPEEAENNDIGIDPVTGEVWRNRT